MTAPLSSPPDRLPDISAGTSRADERSYESVTRACFTWNTHIDHSCPNIAPRVSCRLPTLDTLLAMHWRWDAGDGTPDPPVRPAKAADSRWLQEHHSEASPATTRQLAATRTPSRCPGSVRRASARRAVRDGLLVRGLSRPGYVAQITSTNHPGNTRVEPRKVLVSRRAGSHGVPITPTTPVPHHTRHRRISATNWSISAGVRGHWCDGSKRLRVRGFT